MQAALSESQLCPSAQHPPLEQHTAAMVSQQVVWSWADLQHMEPRGQHMPSEHVVCPVQAWFGLGEEGGEISCALLAMRVNFMGTVKALGLRASICVFGMHWLLEGSHSNVLGQQDLPPAQQIPSAKSQHLDPPPPSSTRSMTLGQDRRCHPYT